MLIYVHSHECVYNLNSLYLQFKVILEYMNRSKRIPLCFFSFIEHYICLCVCIPSVLPSTFSFCCITTGATLFFLMYWRLDVSLA